jgi:hypothetical protein
MDKDYFQVHILACYCAFGVQWLRIAQCDGYLRIGASLPENGKRKKSLSLSLKN